MARPKLIKTAASQNKLLKRNADPMVDPDNYRSSMLEVLNHYNEIENKTKRKWFLEHFKKRIDFNHSSVSDYEFRTAGTLARMLDNGNELSTKDKKRVEDEFIRIKALAEAQAEEKKATPDDVVVEKPNIQDRLAEKASSFVGEFNGLVDDFITSDKTPNASALIKSLGINGPIGKMILAKIKNQHQELKDVVAGKDAQLNEAYGYMKKVKLRKFLAIYDDLAQELQQAKTIVARKIRTVKEKPAGVIVNRLRYAKENEEFGLKSINPAQIVGADEVWTFNGKTRKLQAYKAVDGMTITVKGTTLMNFDTEKSVQKTIRKPETIMAVVGSGKRAFGALFKAAKSTEIRVNGRINGDTILLGAFK